MTIKYNPPRALNQTETLQNLNHWKDVFLNYHRRDKTLLHFLRAGVKWDPSAADGKKGILPQEEGEGKRSATQLAEDLDLFLGHLASFLPFDYVSDQLKNESHNLQECWDIIYEIYEVQIGTDTFMDYSGIKRETGETYRCLYERMCGQVRQHLPKGELTIKGVKTGTGEKMTVALYNLIALNWLDKINPHLRTIVRKELANQFADKKQLCELVPVIAPQIDGMLQRHEIKGTSVAHIVEHDAEIKQVQDSFDPDEYEDDVDGAVRRIQKYKRNQRGGGRGYGDRSFKPGGGDRRPGGFSKSGDGGSNKVCNHCQLLKRTVKSDRSKYIDVNHDPRNCNKRHYAVRLTEAIDQVASDLEASEDEGNILNQIQQQQTAFLQKIDAEMKDFNKKEDKPPDTTCSQCVEKPARDVFNSENISDLTEEENQVFLSEIRRICTNNAVRKADSPSLFGKIEGKGTEVTFDEGAQLNVLDDQFARGLGLKIRETPQMANAANKTPMRVTGQTENDLIVKFNAKAGNVKINLGKVVTVAGLGTTILVGEPGKRDNKIITIPHQKRIEFVQGEHTISIPYHRTRKGKSDYKLARVKEKTTLYPGESIKIGLDEEMTDRELAVTPRAGVDWLTPTIRRVTGSEVELYNGTKEIVNLRKGDQIADIRTCCLSEDTPYIRRVYERMSDDFALTDFSTAKDDFEANLETIQIDPDGILSQEERDMFRGVSEHYKHVFTPRPGKYNGHYGEVGNRLNFASVPAQKTRVYTPNYTPEMKKILAEKLDKLVEWGVLVRPEDYNIQVEVISSSLLVPKHEPGEFRVVTDFTGINPHLKKIPSLTPTIAEARQSLAKSKYIIAMDLSNYFYQGGVVAEDAQYLGTMHPFKGVLVYSCMPQGVKGASESSYERIERVYGDMVQDNRMATMADGIYPKGQTVLETLENYAETLRRASLAGLTFKPSKTIICPLKTELFGWDLDDGKWKPTAHTKSTLAVYEKPSTAKQLRSYLGAWKQLSSCISNYAALLHPLEMMIAGKARGDWLTWDKETEKAFEESKKAAAASDGVYEARPDDVIHTYSDFSQSKRAIGGRMMLHRKDPESGETKILLGGHFSATLDKHKKNWLACEGEAAGIRLTLTHFAPQIRSSLHDAVHHTDSKPCVQAWGRSKKGAYSASSRIATFLTDLSALSVELVYTPGKEMFTSDFASRHPPDCKNVKCQICKFVAEWEILGDNAGSIKAVSIEEILEGKTIMPFTQRRVLRDIQHNDKMTQKLKDIIEQGHLPDKRKTGGEFTKLKLLHNLFKEGRLKVDKDSVIVVKTENGHYNGHSIVLPASIFRGFATALHVRLDHPSKNQLASLLRRYFYSVGSTETIAEIQAGCQQCASMKVLPKVLSADTTSPPSCFGSNFAADVIEINSQNIFVIREGLSQFTQGEIIPDQKASTLEEALLKATLELIPDQGTTIRVDGAKAFQSLAISSKEKESYLNKYNIRVDIGRAFNRNKNPQAENANKEVEKEILRKWPSGRAVNNIELAIVMKTINSRIRYNGYAPMEILLRRDLISHEEKEIRDQEIIEKQAGNRETSSQHQEKFLEKSRKKTPAQSFSIGQLVFIRSQLSKLKSRELFIVEERLERTPATYVIRKATGKLRRTTYEMLEEELIAAPGTITDYREHDEGESNTEEISSEGELIVGPSSEDTTETSENTDNTEENTEQEGELIVGPSENTEREGELIVGPSEENSTESSSNDYELNFKRLPRRQAARKAHTAWNRAVFTEHEKKKKRSPAVAEHGMKENNENDDEDVYTVIEEVLVPRLADMTLGEEQITENEISTMDIDSSEDNLNRENGNISVAVADVNPVTDKNSGGDEQVLDTKNEDKEMDKNGARSKNREARTIEKIIPTKLNSKRRDDRDSEDHLNRSRTMRAGSRDRASSGRRPQRESSDTIDPTQVRDWGDILDQLQPRTRSSSRPAAKKPEGHYKVLHSRGHQD